MTRGTARMLIAVAYVLAAGSCASAPQEEVAELKWPRQFEKGGDTVVVYDPQIDAWEKYEKLSARSAVAVTPKGASAPSYGVVEYVVDTEVNFDSRQVLLEHRKFKAIRFQGADAARNAKAEEIVQRVLGTPEPFYLSLDFALAYVEDHAEKVPAVPVNLEPPPIHVSHGPAVLVILMGPPEFKPVKGTSLEFAVNTNWDLLRDPATSRYYLLHGEGWLTSADLQKGPWEPAASLPVDLFSLPADDANWSEVRKRVPGQRILAPKVIVTSGPAELIVVGGQPVFSPIPGTRLTYVQNTESQLFFHEGEAAYYFLTSGRWFRAKLLEGPWSGATANLPADFAKIPKTSPKAGVRVSVPGTTEAKDAVLLATVPQKATVSRKDLTVTVTYEGGTAQFAAIEGTPVYYAVNSPYNVFRVEGRYYCCHAGVWFESASPTGAWVVCVKVPAAIYTIPPSSPKYSVTYVVVYDSTPDVVIVGYTSGYMGVYVSSGVVVFGVGYAVVYSPYWHYHYHAAFYGYGCGAYYNHYTGCYTRGAAVYGPYGGAGASASYNPHTGTYSRSAYAYGPYGSRYAQSAYNPYTGAYAAQRGGSTPYSSWSQGVAVKGDNWVRGGTYSDARGTVGGARTSEGGRVVAGEGNQGQSGFVGQTGSGDVYAGKNGEVYKKTDDGWQHYEDGGWSSASRDPSTKPATSDLSKDLEKDSRSRERGRQATQQRSRGRSR